MDVGTAIATDWQSMKSMTVSSMEASALSPGALGHSMTHLGPATGKLLCPSLPSFLRVSPFRENQDPMVDARLDFLYRDASAMEKLDEVDDKVYKALQEVRCAQDARLEYQVST
jgi:hypothetical protein